MHEIAVLPRTEKNSQDVDGIKKTISDFLPKIVQSWKSAENICGARVRLLIAPDEENLFICHQMMTEYLIDIDMDIFASEHICNTYDRSSNRLIIGWFEKESLELLSGVTTVVAFLSAEVAKVSLFVDEEDIKRYLSEVKNIGEKGKRVNVAREKKLEDELYLWLVANGFNPEKQVTTANRHRLDIWMPGKIMLELKSGKVSSDDLCQAIDYYASYRMPVLLVGTGMTNAASRAIEGFNSAVGDERAISFVTWNAVKPYLRAVL